MEEPKDDRHGPRLALALTSNTPPGETALVSQPDRGGRVEWEGRGQAGVGSRRGAAGEEEGGGRRAGSWPGGGGSSEEEACWESEAEARGGGQAEEVARRWWSCRRVEEAWPSSRGGEEGAGEGAEGGSPLDCGRQVCHRTTDVEAVLAVPPGGPSSPAVDGFVVANVMEEAASGSAWGLVDTPPSVVVVPSVGPERAVTVGEVGLAPPAGPSEDSSGSPRTAPALVFAGVVVAVAVDLPPVPPAATSGGPAEVLPPAAVAVVVVSSDWLRPRLDVESGTGSVVAADSVLVRVASVRGRSGDPEVVVVVVELQGALYSSVHE